MAASHFFLGVGAGLAILTIPTAVFAPQLDLPQRIGAWVAGPPASEGSRPSAADVASSNRPLRGYVAGRASTPTPEPQAPPTLQPPVAPGAASAASTGGQAAAGPPQAVPTLPPAGLRTGVIRSGGGGAVYVRRVGGVHSADDALLSGRPPG